jgi:hypothetical protein
VILMALTVVLIIAERNVFVRGATLLSLANDLLD